MKSRKILLSLLLFCLSRVNAQDGDTRRLLTYAQVFEDGKPEVFAKLPEIEGWLNDSTYLIWRPDGNRKVKLLKVDAASGDTISFVDFGMINRPYPKSTSGVPWIAGLLAASA